MRLGLRLKEEVIRETGRIMSQLITPINLHECLGSFAEHEGRTSMLWFHSLVYDLIQIGGPLTEIETHETGYTLTHPIKGEFRYSLEGQRLDSDELFSIKSKPLTYEEFLDQPHPIFNPCIKGSIKDYGPTDLIPLTNSYPVTHFGLCYTRVSDGHTFGLSNSNVSFACVDFSILDLKGKSLGTIKCYTGMSRPGELELCAWLKCNNKYLRMLIRFIFISKNKNSK